MSVPDTPPPPAARPRPSDRVCVLGAGAAGLAAAHHLRAAGYARVTVLERERRAGGKCRSVEHEGRTYELGAVFVAPGYRDVRAFVRASGATLMRCPPLRFWDRERGFVDLFAGSARWRGLLELSRYVALSVRHRAVHRPGFATAPAALAAPFAEVARDHGLGLLRRGFEGPFTSFGYGYFEEIPAAYLFKYMNAATLGCCLVRGSARTVAEGYQAVWERVAADLDVRFGQEVRGIERGAVVRVRTADATLECDRLVVASPLQDLPRILDADPEERDLFGRIRTYDYVVFLVEAPGLPPDSAYVPARFDRAHLGRVMAWCRRWDGSDVVQCYLLGDGLDDATLERHVHEDLAAAGGRVRRVLAMARWPYFPHVGPEDFAAGFHRRLEALQGHRNTWYAGEILNFATVDHVAAWSRHLVGRYFGPG